MFINFNKMFKISKRVQEFVKNNHEFKKCSQLKKNICNFVKNVTNLKKSSQFHKNVGKVEDVHAFYKIFTILKMFTNL